MGKKLYVGSISFQATEEDLKKAFSEVGEVESVNIITDSFTNKSKGFGFVEMVSEEDAKKAVEALNGTTFMNRSIVVNEARPQRPRERKSFGDSRRGFDPGRGGFGDRGAKSGRKRR